ncbi:MAG: UDP-3-O-acyl-N-acetylglucosamine deacetylase [candidate division WOR-3 bacterium]
MNKKVFLEGICLNGGFSRLEISPARKVIFKSHKNEAQLRIPLNIEDCSVENHTITIGRKQKIRVVEHLFSALYGLYIFNIEINVRGNEIPFFDGSSHDFVKVLSDFAGKNDLELLNTQKRISVQSGDSFITYEPLSNSELFIDMELNHPYIGSQRIALKITPENYVKQIASARTFVFTDESDPRLKNLPPYGIGITAKGIYSAKPLRFHDEPVRHKILDLLGDIYILQKKIAGKITARNTSHYLNLRFVRELSNAF